MTAPAHILIVEDEEHLAQGLKFNLEAEGYRATMAADGETAISILQSGEAAIDAVLLDVMLPGCDGFTVVETLRASQNYTPVLMLTARGRTEDVMRGLTAGADDYLPKPFDLGILLARLHGLLRRKTWLESQQNRPSMEPSGESFPDVFAFADRVVDFAALELRTPAKAVRLTVLEADLLRYLVQRPGKVVSRKELLEQVWRVHEDTDTRAIDNFIVRLRRYVEVDPTRPVYLETVRGVGYRFLPAT